MRIVIKISRADDESLKAVMYSIDQGGQPLPAGSVTLQGSALKLTVPGIGGAYEGTVSADGNSIKGTWTQGPMPLPLNLGRATVETAWVIPDPPAPVKRMAADADPAFEVASIKLSRPDEQGKHYGAKGRQFSTNNTSLDDLIIIAYGLHPKQIAKGPSWMSSERYDILAEPNGEGQPNDAQWKIMLQKLLADRFKLSFHREKQQLSVMAITVEKNGPKLTKSTGDPNDASSILLRGLGNLMARNATIVDFAQVMQAVVIDRPVVDQTGITGKYDFTLLWMPNETQFANMPAFTSVAPADNGNAPPDLYKAMQQQLGLKMESTKAPVDVLVIDHVEEPSPN
jgi:uncharacterized protein (TIGR03435 family)